MENAAAIYYKAKTKLNIDFYLFIYRWQKMFHIALDKANWSQPKIEKSYIYIKA